ncbi:sensor histidine kinase [Lachnospiraceae bacterium]|nr:sensor histidine kinase [Lachnospiraceae bacterium]
MEGEPGEMRKKPVENGKNYKKMCIWKNYLKDRYPLLLGFVFLSFIFFAVAGLYGYDGSVIKMFYAVILSFFAGSVICFFDYLRYRGKCLKLQEALMKDEESDYCLPSPKGLIEGLYYDIVCQMGREKRELITELDEKRADMMDYYTMWIHQIKIPIAALKLLQQRMEEEGRVENQVGEAGLEEEAWEKARKRNARQSQEELFKIEQYAEMALHYARLDSMSSDMLFKKYDIDVIIKRALKKYAVLFIGSGLSFSMEEFSCKAVTDEKWLGFVAEQILANALKYTNEGGIRIYGSDKNGQSCTGEVRYVVIEDTGIGIRESDLPRIFERGFTGYNGRMEKKSTGIGLYLCCQIMDKLSHSIRVESMEGEGTKVILGFMETEEIQKD